MKELERDGMNSAWLDAQRQKHKNTMDAEQNTARQQMQKNQYDARVQIDRVKRESMPGWIWVVGIVLAFVFWPLLLLIPVAAIAFYSDKKDRIRKLEQQIADEEKTCKEACRRAEQKMRQAIQSDEARYKREVDRAVVHYCGSKNIRPVVQWLAAHMVVRLKAADKRSYLPRFSATLEFQVDATGVTVLGSLPHTGGKTPDAHFQFLVNNLRDITDQFSQFGCAKALGELLKEEIKRQAVKGGHTLSAITMTTAVNDGNVTLNYSELNPNYQHPKTL